jgi:mannosyltransferase OCH1-like enzyme
MTTFDQTQPVPKVVHQIWVQGDPPAGSEAEQMIAKCREVAQAARWTHMLWSYVDGRVWGRSKRGSECRAEVGQRSVDMMAMGRTVTNQSDILRLLVLGKMGGLYVDADVDVRSMPGDLCGAWITAYRNDPHATDNCVLACPPGHVFPWACLDWLAVHPQVVREHGYIGPVAAVNVMKERKGIVQVWPGKLWNHPEGIYGHHLMKHKAWGSWQIPAVR